MAERDSWAVMNGATRVVDAEDTRVATSALWTPTGTVGNARQGIVSRAGVPGKVQATGTPGINVTVDAFQSLITATRGLGSYIGTLDAQKTMNVLGTDPADPSNQRNDLIVAQQSDTYYSDGSTAYTIRRVKGTPAGTPVDPNPTTGGFSPDYMLLARIRVTAGAPAITNAMIDDLRSTYCVALGGVIPVASAAERSALSAYDGQAVYRRDKDWVEVYDGAAWRTVGVVPVAAGGDITDPYVDQLVMLLGDHRLYRWNGAAWVVVADLSGATPGGEWTISAPLAIGTPTLINNWTPFGGITPVGISHSAGTFTLTNGGVWDISLSCRWSNATADKYCFITGAAALTPILYKSASSTVANTGSAAGPHRFAAGGQFRCYGYAGSASNVDHENVNDLVTGVTAYWRGP